MNYFEALGIDEAETDEQVITTAYQQARSKWQTLLMQGVGEQQRQARHWMNGELETAYETLRDATKRQQYLRQLKLTAEPSAAFNGGDVRINFSLANGHVDHDFLVVENPVRHALETGDGLTIGSVQEYICRVWEDSHLGLAHLADRTLERWLRYAAADGDLAQVLQYLERAPDALPPARQLVTVLSLLQQRYPVPILPRRPQADTAWLAPVSQPHWRVTPSVVNFGMQYANDAREMQLTLHVWQASLNAVEAAVDHAAIALDTSCLADGRLLVKQHDGQLARGEQIEATITLHSPTLGTLQVPVVAARPNRLFGNQEAARKVYVTAAQAARDKGDDALARAFYRLAQDHDGAAAATKALVQQAHRQQDWRGVIDLARDHRDDYGHDDDIQQWLVEALVMIGGSLYQLGEHRRALRYLAAIAGESARLPAGRLPDTHPLAQPEAQLRLDLRHPKADWVNVAESYDLNWTHATGRADGSNYAGEVPIDLSDRRLVWRSRDHGAVPGPLLAYEGVVVVRTTYGLIALDAAAGEVVWQQSWQAGGRAGTVPVAGAGCIFAVDPAGQLLAFSAVEGKEKWSVQLDDNRDVTLACHDGVLYAGTGKRLQAYAADTGELLYSTDEMTAMFGWMGANPVNILITDNCCLFQKVAGTEPSMVFLDLRAGTGIEFSMPFNRSWAGVLFDSLFGETSGGKATWAAYGDEVYLPVEITQEVACRTTYRDNDGKQRERVERKQWGELHFFVYNVRHDKVLAHVWRVTWGTAYEATRSCSVSIVKVRSANGCAVAPAYIEREGEANIIGPVQEGRPLHRVVAAGFGRDVYYWMSTDKAVKLIGHRRADGEVQAIAFTGYFDLVTTTNSLSTSFVGNTEVEDAMSFDLRQEVGKLVGPPALYGDVLYGLTRKGKVVALAR